MERITGRERRKRRRRRRRGSERGGPQEEEAITLYEATKRKLDKFVRLNTLCGDQLHTNMHA